VATIQESWIPGAQVRESYNRIAAAYLSSRRRDSPDVALLDDLIVRLPPRARVLDAGCGAGVPIAQQLATRADVVGVDFAEVQLGLARRHVPHRALGLCGPRRTASRGVLRRRMLVLRRHSHPARTARRSFSMALHVCCGREGWPFFALARRTCRPGRRNTTTRQCTGATTTPRRVFRWWRLPASSWYGIVGSPRDLAVTCSCWPSGMTRYCSLEV